jgi:hypothetical protein
LLVVFAGGGNQREGGDHEREQDRKSTSGEASKRHGHGYSPKQESADRERSPPSVLLLITFDR